tara:strand:- start:592 stop:963 length:372 start_codon:yes stop_codon:yes gene_type:complete
LKQDKSIEKDIKWETLVEFVNSRFGMKEYLGIQAVLFLIGLNELGKGYKELEKEEQLNLLHIAICRLLSNYGYYEYTGRDKDGWPHWKTNTSLPKLNPEEQINLIKEAALLYFDEAGIDYSLQ